MADPQQGDEIPIVCFCHGVLEREVRAAIAGGARTVKAVQEKTRASTGCGGCRGEVERLLEEITGEPAKAE